MCAYHWRKVPNQLQRDVWNNFVNGQERKQIAPTQKWHLAADAAINFVFDLENKNCPNRAKEIESMRLDLGIQAGDNTKAFLADLTGIVERFEKVARILRSPEENDAAKDDSEENEIKKDMKKAKGKKTAKSFDDEDEETDTDETEVETETETDDEDDNDFGAKKKPGRKAAKSFDDDEDEESEDEEKPVAAKKGKGKPKALTLKEVNEACQTRSQRTSFKATQALLQKHFGVKTTTGLDPEQFAEVIELMNTK